jgi:recombinational DNA repair ATPase RecF
LYGFIEYQVTIDSNLFILLVDICDLIDYIPVLLIDDILQLLVPYARLHFEHLVISHLTQTFVNFVCFDNNARVSKRNHSGLREAAILKREQVLLQELDHEVHELDLRIVT